MIIITDKNVKLDLIEAPVWNEKRQEWGAPGYRWIKTTQKFSGNRYWFSFKSYREIEA